MAKDNSNLYLILAICAAGLIIGGAILYVRFAQLPEAAAGPGSSLQPYSEQLLIPESMRSCRNGDRCIVVDTMCSFCCKYVAINALHEELFNQMFNQNCDSYSGAMCECFDLSSYPLCVEGKCSLVKFQDEKF